MYYVGSGTGFGKWMILGLSSISVEGAVMAQMGLVEKSGILTAAQSVV